MMKLALHWQIAIGMTLGALIGISLNIYGGTRTTIVQVDELPAAITSLEIHDSSNHIRIDWTTASGDKRSAIVDGTRKTPGAAATVDELRHTQPEAAAWFHQFGRSTARVVGETSQLIGNLFLRLLQMVAVPLIITSLICGITGLGDAASLGGMFLRTILYYICTSAAAITIGLVAVNIFRPGITENAAPAVQVVETAGQSLGTLLFEQVERMIPTNPIAAIANSHFLSIISFTLAFSIFAVIVGGKTLKAVRAAAEAGFEVMMAMTMAIIALAPIGVLCLMLFVTATQGPAVFASLFWYLLTVVAALLTHALIVLPLILRFVARRDPIAYAKALSPALLTAFSSASSNGTLPLTMACVENRAGVDNRISSFVLPLGATINMDGTALYEAVAVLFIGQLYYGAVLPLEQQLIVAITALLASIGAAGIPHAGLVMMIVILQAVGLPIEMQGIILAVDRVLDMFRTSVNVWSDSCGCAVVAALEQRSSKNRSVKTT
ncbi:MAG: dicarboxylate/amino acid:cation symporter [Planctomycetaceae bacterium]|nr:dicarboxylate/amino acid:cation symporter [Planctomycetaceae bacterium]